MLRSITSVFLLSWAVGLLIPGNASAEYPVEQRLCDVAYQNCRTQVLDLINAEPASGSIDVAFWFMEDSRYSNALVNAAKRGVRVRVLFDTEALNGSGSDIDIRKQIIAQLAGAGIPMRYKSNSGILHWKMMIFGAQDIVNFSAGNFSPDGYVPWEPYVNYEDEVISFTTDAGLVSTFKTKYDDVWTTTTGYTNYANVTTLERFHPTSPLDARLNFPPYQNYATRAVKLYDQEMVGIDVDMYRITQASHADAMIRAVQRGVPVRLYTEQLQYRDANRLWHSYNVDRMYLAGVQVKDRAHQGLNHQKSVILHSKHTIIFGSSNWTSPSASSQLEHNIFTTENFYFDFFVNQFNRKWNNTGPAPETKPFVPLPPDKPINNAPANGATNQNAAGVVLKWNAGFWAHKYDIYVGTSPTLSAANLVAADLELGPSESASDFVTFTTPPLQAGTTYYWQIVSKTMANKTATGPVWSFATAGTPGPGGGGLPAGWSATDIGAVGAAGTATYDSVSGQYTVSGSGADIWGSADEFQFVYRSLTGDGSITARVASVSGEHAWTKAGVMMRDGFGAGAAHGTMFVSSAKGLAFQRRATPNGTSASTAGPLATAPYWVRMSRAGNVLTASISTDGTNFTPVGTQTIAMNSTIQVGLAVTSHLDGTLSTALIDNVVVVTGGQPPPPPPPPPGPLPSGWVSNDVGNTTPTGSASYDTATSTYTLSGAGADIWGTADAFQFAHTLLDGDGEIVARVDSATNVDVWTKVGVMFRDGLAANAAHATMLVTPTTTKGSAYQRRQVAGGLSSSTAGPTVRPPYWVKLVRLGSSFSAYTSPDGAAWTLVGTDTIAMAGTANVGLVVSSHRNGTLATATFSSVTVTRY